MDQFAVGLEGRPVPKLKVSVLALARRQSPQIHGVNIGVPLSGYTTFTVPDANHDTRGERGRSDVDHLQPAPGDVRIRSVPAHQSRHHARNDGVAGRRRRAHDEACVLPDGRHFGTVRRRGRQSWIHRRRERSGHDRRAFRGSQRGHLRARPALQRSDVHDQDPLRRHAAARHPRRSDREISGRAGVLAHGDRARPQPGHRSSPRLSDRTLAIHVSIDARRSPAEANSGTGSGARLVPRHLQPAQHVERSGRVRGHGPALSAKPPRCNRRARSTSARG